MITHVPAETGPLGQPTIDPVCGMEVDPATSAYRVDRGEHVIHFCSADCRAKFEADPEKYAAARAPVSASAGSKIAGATYTCPMHPQIRRDAPGSCPICGMTLEPLRARQEITFTVPWRRGMICTRGERGRATGEI
jgi:Cu+-exporting ATPase